jgi:hypothetical protein
VVEVPVGDRNARGPRLLVGFCSAAARLLPACKRAASGARDGAAMTVAQITPPAPRTDALAGHAYCLPVVRELSAPADDPAGDRSW